MTRLSRFAVANKRAVILSALMLSALGFFMIFKIPQGVFPDATFPRIAVLVDFGLAPLKQMEMEIVKPLEEAVMGVPGVRLVRASISRGAAEINIDFAWDEDMFKALQLVQAKVSGVRNALSNGVQIEVRRFTSSTYAVSGYGLSSDRLGMVALTDIATYSIRPQLASIPGVEQVEIMGAHLREYWVNLDPKKLAAFKLDYRQVADALQQTNSVQFVGRLNEFNKLYLNVADNRFMTLDDLGDTVVANRYPTPVHLADIADIEPAVQEQFISTVNNHQQAVLFTIIKQPGTSAVSVSDAVEHRLRDLRKTLPASVHIEKWYDMSGFIRTSIDSVRDAILLGALLTVVILLLFLKKLRLTFVTAAIIPVAVLMTFLLIKLFEMNLSLMSLGGLAAAIGILVDNAIVVVENIERYLEEDPPQKEVLEEVIVQATGEIIAPLLGATLTTLVVFIPLVFLTGVPGIFFRALATTLTFAILISMLLSIFLTPALASVLISEKVRQPGHVLPKLIALQQYLLNFSFRQPWFPLLLILSLSGSIAWGYQHLPSGFLPEWDEGTIVLDYMAPPGSSLEGTKNMLRTIEEKLKTFPEVETYSLRTGRSLAHPRKPSNEGDFVIDLKKDRQRSAPDIMDALRAFITKAEPRLQTELFQVLPDRLNDLSGEIAPVVVKIFGNNLDLMRETAQEVSDQLKAVPGIVDVYRGFNPGEPELAIHVNGEAASRYGLTVQDVNRAVKMALWGEVPTAMLQGLKIVPIRLRYSKTELNHLEKIRQMPIYLPKVNRVVRLEALADLSKRPGEPDLDHENLSQVVNVEANLSGRDLGNVIHDIQRALGRIRLPPGVTLKLAGQYESQQKAFQELLMIVSSGIALVFIILLFEFKSFRTSAVILFGTVLATSGVFMALLLTGVSLDISAFMGMIMIIGVVVNNGILLIDYTEIELKKQPMSGPLCSKPVGFASPAPDSHDHPLHHTRLPALGARTWQGGENAAAACDGHDRRHGRLDVDLPSRGADNVSMGLGRQA